MLIKFINYISNAVGLPKVFIGNIILVLLWGFAGYFFGFSLAWQMVGNLFISIITYLVLFIIQHTQNRNEIAIHRKLDEIIHAIDKADDKLIGIEKECD